MKLDDLQSIARKHNIKVSGVNKSDLVRAIQQTEGNSPCFNSSSSAVCGQHDCLWRADCN